MAKPARELHLPPLHQLSSVQSSARQKRRQIASNTVTVTALAGHLDLSRQRVHQLVDEHVIARSSDGRFDQDDSRVRYLRWIREPERRSVRTQVDAEHVKAKTEMLQLKLAEKRGELVPVSRMSMR